MCNISSYFINNFSVVTGPLKGMTRKYTFEWMEETHATFAQVKELLTDRETQYFKINVERLSIYTGVINLHIYL